MIISITCVHDALTEIERRDVERELTVFGEYDSSITRIEVIFTKQTHNTRLANLVTCHVSIQAPNHRHIDVYEQQPSVYESFDKAKELAIKKLSKTSSTYQHSIQTTSLLEKREQI